MRRLRFPLWVCCFLVAASSASAFPPAALTAADNKRGFVDRVYSDESGQHKYVVFVPSDYTPRKKWPAILFLHGAGERGTDGRRQLNVGLGPYVKQRADSFKFLVVFPQCEDRKGEILKSWAADSPDGRRAGKILDDVERTYNVDKSRRILTGWSMGGYGAWSLAAAAPDHWSAVVPMSGGGDAAVASNVKSVPIWAIHGADDTVVPVAESRQMVEAVKKAGGRPRYSEVANAGHNVWQHAYANEGLYRWMLNPNAPNAIAERIRVQPGERPPLQPIDAEPFVPALEIPNAVFVRMGNDMLKTLAESVPRIIPRDVLSGGIGDIHESTSVSGYTFAVRFSGISYNGTVERAIVKAYRKDRLNVQLGLRNIVLRINQTYVTGDGRSAVAGPIDVVIGNRRPVWLSLALEPYVDKRNVRVRLIATRFEIPGDNWYVSGPAGVSTRGFGMTREKVANGLVSGIYGKKARIEYEVNAVVPKLLARLEENLQRKELSDVATAFWPLPVYQPRLRAWPQAISTDENGVSLALGITAAAVDARRAPRTPRILDPAGPALSELPRGKRLEVGVAPGILGPLTELLIEADLARVHVRDLPEKRFALLADRNAMAPAIPELRRLGDGADLRAELVLVSPLSMLDGQNVAAAKSVSEGGPASESPPSPSKSIVESPRSLRISAPKLDVALAVRPDRQASEWSPFADIDISLEQEAVASVKRPTFRKRALQFEWKGEPKVDATARFASSYQPQEPNIDVEQARRLFVDAWKAWTQDGPLSQSGVADVDFGFTKLRLNSADWTGTYLMLQFAEPGIKITNNSEVELVYEYMGPNTGWGGPYRLAPGKSHDFPVAYPILYRHRMNGQYQTFTLPVGMDFEFRSPAAGAPPTLIQAREQVSAATAAADVATEKLDVK